MPTTSFKDRVVQYPGRRRLTPVAGQDGVYDITREEGTVAEQGTPINADVLNSLATSGEITYNELKMKYKFWGAGTPAKVSLSATDFEITNNEFRSARKLVLLIYIPCMKASNQMFDLWEQIEIEWPEGFQSCFNIGFQINKDVNQLIESFDEGVLKPIMCIIHRKLVISFDEDDVITLTSKGEKTDTNFVNNIPTSAMGLKCQTTMPSPVVMSVYNTTLNQELVTAYTDSRFLPRIYSAQLYY